MSGSRNSVRCVSTRKHVIQLLRDWVITGHGIVLTGCVRSDFRRSPKTPVLKDQCRFLANSTFGKTMEHDWNRVNIRLIAKLYSSVNAITSITDWYFRRQESLIYFDVSWPSGVSVEFNGTPLSMIGRKVLECASGRHTHAKVRSPQHVYVLLIILLMNISYVCLFFLQCIFNRCLMWSQSSVWKCIC